MIKKKKERDRESGEAGRLTASRKACEVICLVSSSGLSDFRPIRPLKKYLVYSVIKCVRCKELRECSRHSGINTEVFISIT
jgi:hypothetical protein